MLPAKADSLLSLGQGTLWIGLRTLQSLWQTRKKESFKTSSHRSPGKIKVLLFAAVNVHFGAPPISPGVLALIFHVWLVIRVRAFALGVFSKSPIVTYAVFRVIGLRSGLV